MSQRRRCLNDPNHFCYICGEYVFTDMRMQITPLIKERYYKYFKMRIGDQEKSFAPHTVCKKCSSNLSMWSAGKLTKLPFSTPMSWREQRSHGEDCYFCLTKVAGFNKKNANKIIYPDLPSAIRPRLYEGGEIPPVYSASSENSVEEIEPEEEMEPADEEWKDETKEPSKMSQQQLDLLVRRLGLSKADSAVAGSLLKGFGVLAPETKFAFYRDRDRQYSQYFKTSDRLGFVYCHDVLGLMSELGILTNVRNDWWLFIDGSVSSVKAVLLHVQNRFPALPVGYSREAKESYEVMKYLFQLLRYEEYQWMVGGDFKMIGILTGLQAGYTKYCCFLCLWDSRARAEHYDRAQWPPRVNRTPGQTNIRNNAIVPPTRILLPALHIKLGLVKNFVKTLNKEGAAMLILKDIFPKLSAAKLKEGVFVGPDIRRLMKHEEFKNALNPVECRAWEAVIKTVRNFLGKHRSNDYKDVINEMLAAFKDMGVNMSLKIHFLRSHLDFFPSDLGNISDEHGERFHQTLSIIEKRFMGRADERMMGDFCWLLEI